MKKLILLLMLGISLSATSQLTNGQFNLYAKYSYGSNSTSNYNNYGLTGEIIIHDHFGLNYNFDLIQRSDNFRQIHTPMGIVGGPLFIAAGLVNLFDGDSTSKGGLALVGLALLLLPEGVSFHQNIGFRWDVSPYANILGIDFIKNRSNGENWIKYACSFGVRGTYILKERMTISPFIETRKTASIPWSIGGGIGVGILMGKRNIDAKD